MLGLTGQPRAIAFHTDEKTGHEHMHVAWSRIDEDTLTAKQLPFFKCRLKKISRELELHFGLTIVSSRREGPIKYAPTRAEEEQARRLGVDIHEVRNTIRDCWDRSDCGRSFEAALADKGLILAQGEQRDFIVIDDEGGMHALGKRILGVQRHADRASACPTSTATNCRPSNRPAILSAMFRGNGSGRSPAPVWDRDRYHNAWHDAVIKAAIEKEKIERRFVEPKRDRETRAGGREKEAPSRFQEAARAATSRTPPPAIKHTRQPERSAPERAGKEIRVPAIITRAPLRAVGKTLDIVGNVFESLFAPKLTPEQIRQGEKAAQKREAEAEHSIDFSKYTALRAQERQREENEREAERRQHRERGGGGRER